MCCLYSGLKNKEVINVINGKALGYVCDIEINPATGQILKLLLPGEGIGGYFSAKKRIAVPYGCIERIGGDVILVRFAELPAPEKEKSQKGQK